MKVTDKRMFTPDGELRENPVDLENSVDDDAPHRKAQDLEIPEGPEVLEETESDVGPQGKEPTAQGKQAPPENAPSESMRHGPPGFLDLVALLAEPTALYLGDVSMPDGKSVQDLSLARFHIDLLEIVQQKSAGNLSSHEASVLNDVLYRLRMRYVEKKG